MAFNIKMASIILPILNKLSYTCMYVHNCQGLTNKFKIVFLYYIKLI